MKRRPMITFGSKHSTCKTSWGRIYLGNPFKIGPSHFIKEIQYQIVKEILYKFFRFHEKKGLYYRVFLNQHFQNFETKIGFSSDIKRDVTIIYILP